MKLDDESKIIKKFVMRNYVLGCLLYWIDGKFAAKHKNRAGNSCVPVSLQHVSSCESRHLKACLFRRPSSRI